MNKENNKQEKKMDYRCKKCNTIVIDSQSRLVKDGAYDSQDDLFCENCLDYCDNWVTEKESEER
jgi:hypothetical protein